LIAALRDAEIQLLAPILPGHENAGPRMPASLWTDWAAAAQAAFDGLADDGQPVAVIGFSTGATLAVELASRKPINRLVLLAPFLAIRYSGWIPLRPASYLQLLAKLIADLPRRGPAVRDPQMRRWAASADRYGTFNVHAAVSALELIDTVKPLVSLITAPTLIIQGLLDTVVEPAGAEWLFKNLGSEEKQLIYLAHSDHLVALDVERQLVIDAILQFLDLRQRSEPKP
jgi:carboxylesterase